MRNFVLLACLLPCSAIAGDVISHIEADIDGDGKNDTAILSAANGYADLLITASSGGQITVSNAAWMGASAGTIPSLSVSSSGALTIHSMNEAIGRIRWHQVLTVAYRDGSFLVAGFTYDWRDTTDMDTWGHCDLNLLTRKGSLSLGQTDRASEFEVYSLRAVPITEWEDVHPEECRPE